MTDPIAPDVLRRFLLGELSNPELDRVTAYLDRHPDLAATLNALNVSAALLDALERCERTDDSPAVAALITQLSELSAAPDAPTTDPVVSAGAPANVLAILEPPDRPGALGRLGRYRVLRVLECGSTGAVFEAEEDQLKRRVALKVVPPELAADSAARERFLRAAVAAARIEHANIVPICDLAEVNGVPFLTMPLLVGETLDERLKPGALPVTDLLLIGRHVAEGLAAAHAAGLVHRALKPANVWLERAPTGVLKRARILDFGPAHALHEAGLSPDAVGAHEYMAPEQARGEKVDPRADLFSLGCILYQMATGQRPFRGADASAILSALTTETPPAPHHLNPTVPAALSALVELLLSKDPINRWPPTAHEVGDELFRIANDPLSLSGPRPGLPPAPARPTMRATAVPKPEEVWPGATAADEAESRYEDDLPMATAVDEEPRWRRRAWVLAACALLALVGYFSETIVRIATDKGELAIEADDPSIEVMVVRGDSVLVDKTGKRELVIKSGDGEVIFFHPKSDAILLVTKFELTRGGQVTVRAPARGTGEARPKP